MWDKEPLLAVRGMRKSFGRLEVLTGVDIDLRHGEVLGIVGPNGVGKSTMASTTVSLGSSSFWGSMSMICRGSHGPPERLATPSSADV